MADRESESTLSDVRRQEIFMALVTAQDQGMPVDESRRVVAGQFGITESQMSKIEREGLDNNWPPL